MPMRIACEDAGIDLEEVWRRREKGRGREEAGLFCCWAFKLIAAVAVAVEAAVAVAGLDAGWPCKRLQMLPVAVTVGIDWWRRCCCCCCCYWSRILLEGVYSRSRELCK